MLYREQGECKYTEYWLKRKGGKDKVHVYLEYPSVSVPSLGLGLLIPLFRKRVCMPPSLEPKGGVRTRLRVRGWGSPNSDGLRKGLAFCLLCGGKCLTCAEVSCHEVGYSWWSTAEAEFWPQSVMPLWIGPADILFPLTTTITVTLTPY